MGKKFELGLRAQEIVDGLKEVLGGLVLLVDGHRKRVHAARATGWLSLRLTRLDGRRHRCTVEAPIHDRWTLVVIAAKGQMLHPDAELLVDWAAVKLAHYLPERPAMTVPYPPANGGGGPAGSAEVGIPVWWARRTRS